MYKQRHIDIKHLYADSNTYIGQNVLICGWIRFFRKNKDLCFVRLSDGSCVETLQIIFDKKSLPEKSTDFDSIFEIGKTGMSCTITGKIVKSPKDNQPIEMQAISYEICGDVANPDTYPIAKKEHTLEYLRTVPHLRIRTDTYACVNRIKSVMMSAIREYFDKLGFHEVQVPLITDNECESGANRFTVTTLMSDKIDAIPTTDKSIDYSKDFFKKHTYLTVSGQLHLECLVLGGLGKAYTLTNAFRAEKSLSPLHLGEFWMLEQEFCFNTVEENMDVNEGLIKYCIGKVLKKCYSDLEFLQQKYKKELINTLKKYCSTPFVRTTHEICVKQMLVDIGSGKVKIDPKKKPDDGLFIFKEIPTLDGDLSKDHEKYITQVMYDNVPVFVKHYCFKIKAFYMPKINKGDNIERVDNFDLLFPFLGEVAGGSQRETNYEELISRMKEHNIDPMTLQFYLDLRKYGSAKHGGSGLGFDRILLSICGLSNIKDTVPFPRSYGSCQF